MKNKNKLIELPIIPPTLPLLNYFLIVNSPVAVPTSLHFCMPGELCGVGRKWVNSQKTGRLPFFHKTPAELIYPCIRFNRPALRAPSFRRFVLRKEVGGRAPARHLL